MLEAWHHIALDYSGSVSDASLDVFVSRLCGILSRLSYSELRDMAYSLTLLAPGPRLTGIACLLDHYLAERLRHKLGTEPSQEVISECLEVAYIWLKHGLLSAADKPKLSSKDLRSLHNTQLVDLLLQHHLERLTPSQAVFSLFLAGISREYPGLVYNNLSLDSSSCGGGSGHPVPLQLHDKLAEILPQLTDLEVGVVCHGLHQTHLHLQTRHHVLRNTLLSRMINFPLDHATRDEVTLSCMAKMLKKRGTENQAVIGEILTRYQPYLANFQHFTKIRLLQMAATAKPSHKLVHPFIRHLLHTIPNLNILRLKDLEQLAFCLVFLCDESEAWRPHFLRIQEAMTRCNWSDVRSGRSFVYLTTYLSRVGVYDLASIDAIFEEVNKCDTSDLETDLGLANAIEFLFRLNIPFVSDFSNSSSYVVNFLQRNAILCRTALFLVMELETVRQVFQLDTRNRLSAEKHNQIRKYFQNRGCESSLTPNGISSSTAHWDNLTFHDRTLHLIYRDIVAILGSHRQVELDYPLPHSPYRSPIIIREADIGSRRMDDQWNSGSSVSRHRCEVVMVPRKSEISREGVLYGHVRSQIHQLRTLGHSVVVINWSDYYTVLKRKKNLSFLRNKIKLT